MKRYFKYDNSESDIGGTAYMEIDGDWAVRQCEIGPEDRSNSSVYDTMGEAPFLCDQSIDAEMLEFMNETTENDFTENWSKSMEHDNERWNDSKNMYTIGSNLVANILVFYPNYTLANIDQTVFAVDHDSVNGQLSNEQRYSGASLNITVLSYDENNHWIIANAK